MSDGQPTLSVSATNIKNSLSEDETLYHADMQDTNALRAMTNRLKLDRPRNAPKQQGAAPLTGNSWRVTLTLADDPARQKAFIVKGDAVLGSLPLGDPRVQVSLEDWDARDRGVSRTHVTIRTGPTRLLLLDMGSTNGTFLNSVPISRGWAHTLADGDLLTLGALSLWVHIIEQPAG